MRILFPYIAQPHQTLHSLPIAMETAGRHSDISVHIACATATHLDYARHLASFYPGVSVQFELLKLPRLIRQHVERHGHTVMSKLASLFYNKNYFSSFQAVVVPERTSLYLRKLGVSTPRMIWTRHGAGDRAVGFARDVRLFDYVLMAGRKLEQRLLADGSIRPGRYKTGVYAKFDMVRRLQPSRPRLFDNDRPTILYNPHFSRRLSSWPRFGLNILNHFANQNQYNLIFAPHYRLFDNNRKEVEQLHNRFDGHPNILIDPGSPCSLDMTYTMGSDLYLGDVSSQVAEFLVRPRPCLFMNAHNALWEDKPDYRFWSLGHVRSTSDDIIDAAGHAFATHNDFIERQKDYIRDTFDLTGETPTAPVGADAIVDYLRMAS
ncbi:MAG: sensor domain-containing protein [Acetobacter sp.]|jgi:hypothetical protein|nr:sensor domain-containing protein [Acetobacter sp.]MCH4061414.1 sensor domain-containing protein [Acetobacter sp.]MCI1295028.1 sensor domain-containing protein [Acetobacter sp.]MCI1321600.1 sensor domain-containing protein [Acetobacter sp.]MCI1375015.1 sensor domain-containing protein [Acetobacter sp.]